MKHIHFTIEIKPHQKRVKNQIFTRTTDTFCFIFIIDQYFESPGRKKHKITKSQFTILFFRREKSLKPRNEADLDFHCYRTTQLVFVSTIYFHYDYHSRYPL